MDQPTFPGSNINQVKAHNMQALLLILLHHAHISRVELARQTALSTTTITNLTSELLVEGIIVEEDSPQPPGERRVGRPRTMLRLVPDARYAVGVHIGIGLLRVAVTNLHAEMVHNRIAHFELDTPAEEVLSQVGDLIEATLTESGVDLKRVVGVGVGASGLVDFWRGVNVFAPRLNWREVPIAEILERRLALPICVDNNVRCMALGEAYFGAGQGVGLLAFVYGRVGVGSGLVFNGQVFRGGGAGAGEIGHMTMVGEGGEQCTCGNRGCLETLVSERVLIRQAKKLAQENPTGILAQYMAEADDDHLISAIFQAACDGDGNMQALISDLANSLGVALSNLVNLFNPELIILGGLFAQGCDLILPVAERTMRETAFAGLGEHVQVRTTSFGWRAGVIGAAALALMTYFYQSERK